MTKTRVFLSWSGERSRDMAAALHRWISDVLQGVEPWMSESDIDKGTRWSEEIAAQLESARVGVICLTPENLTAPWLLFEAGALSKIRQDSYVCTYLLGLQKSAVPFPLATFQATEVTKEDTRKLLGTINRLMGETGLAPDQLNRAFDRWWPDLEAQLAEIANRKVAAPAAPTRDERDVLEELVTLVRGMDRKLAAMSGINESLSPIALNYWRHVQGPSPAQAQKQEKLFATLAEALLDTSWKDPSVTSLNPTRRWLAQYYQNHSPTQPDKPSDDEPPPDEPAVVT